MAGSKKTHREDPLVDAALLRREADRLRAMGWSCTEIAAATGRAPNTLYRALTQAKTVRSSFVEALRAVNGREDRPEPAQVPAAPVREELLRLVGRGWAYSDLAERCLCSGQALRNLAQGRVSVVSSHTARAIASVDPEQEPPRRGAQKVDARGPAGALRLLVDRLGPERALEVTGLGSHTASKLLRGLCDQVNAETAQKLSPEAVAEGLRRGRGAAGRHGHLAYVPAEETASVLRAWRGVLPLAEVCRKAHVSDSGARKLLGGQRTVFASTRHKVLEAWRTELRFEAGDGAATFAPWGPFHDAELARVLAQGGTDADAARSLGRDEADVRARRWAGEDPSPWAEEEGRLVQRLWPEHGPVWGGWAELLPRHSKKGLERAAAALSCGAPGTEEGAFPWRKGAHDTLAMVVAQCKAEGAPFSELLCRAAAAVGCTEGQVREHLEACAQRGRAA